MKSLVIRFVRRCVCCLVTAAFVASNAYTYKISYALGAQDICSDMAYYYNKDVKEGLVSIKGCEKGE